MAKDVRLSVILEFLQSDILNIYGNPGNICIKYLKEPRLVDEFTLDWINSNKNDKQAIAENSKAKAIVTTDELDYSEKIRIQNKILIIVKNPKLVIAKVGNHFFAEKIEPFIHPTAVIHPDAIIGNNAFIGANVYIGECIIGNNARIFSNVSIYNNVKIGNDVVIHSGVVIGTDGLGCERDDSGKLTKFPHFGGVSIGNEVEIGANSQIAKGVFSDTIICDGVKINGLCFIAHNCVLEENVWITGNSMLAGSVRVEKNVTIFSKVIVREQRCIKQGAIVGMGAVVTKDVPAGETWIGNPAKSKI